MNSKHTVLWLILAAALAAMIWLLPHPGRNAEPARTNLLRGLRAADVTRLKVNPAGVREISVFLTNRIWQMEQPVSYPAQAGAIESFLDTFGKLCPVMRLSANELRGHNVETEYGFANPQFSIVVSSSDQTWQILVGNRTPPGDQVFVRVVGLDGAFITDTAWLQFLPHSANDWRDTSLIGPTDNYDWLVITNTVKAIAMEFRRDPTNHLWRMLHPLVARADNARLATALQQLRTTQVTRFVTDESKVDLGSFGLQPPGLSLWLGKGTNFIAAIHAGKKSTDVPGQVFVRREGLNSILAIPEESLTAWQGFVSEFRELSLIDFSTPAAEVAVSGGSNFILRCQDTNHWTVVGEKYPADLEKVQTFLRQLAGLRVAGFEKDANSAVDLKSFGLAAPARQVTLRAVAGNTNAVIAQLYFGTETTNKVFVKRADEDSVYWLVPEDVASLPRNAWEFRSRKVWHFSETNIVQVTLHQGGKTRQLLRSGLKKWSLAGSAGPVDSEGLEASMQMLGNLNVVGWVEHNPPEPEKLGFHADNLRLDVELKSGEILALDFGMEFSQTALIATTLDGDRWIGALPRTLFQVVTTYLTIPVNTP